MTGSQQRALSDGRVFGLWSTIVPKRYLRSSGLLTTSLMIRGLWYAPFRFVKDSDGSPSGVPPAALCVLDGPKGAMAVLVDIKRHPELAEALLLLGGLRTVDRTKRYLTVYQAYECLQPKPAIEFAAIRHALSHPSANLSRPGTIAALVQLFGTKRINLTSGRHQRVFYAQLVRLLSEVDRTVYDMILARLPALRILSQGSGALLWRPFPGTPEVVWEGRSRPTRS